VFAEIAKAKPPKLLVVGDGARANREGEAKKVAAVRSIIKKVDWDCEVLTNYSDTNLGCKKRVATGIDWIFEQVEEAIILEDDCLPDPTFFRFCEEMLERYRDDDRVGMVSGNNFQFGRKYDHASYYFSKYMHIWGWATWRDRWQETYDVALTTWPQILAEDRLDDMVGNKIEAISWKATFQSVFENKIDTWDCQWLFANWLHGRVCVLPSINLISNIGYGSDATHTFGVSELSNMSVLPMTFPLSHPTGLFKNVTADCYYSANFIAPNLWRRIRKRAFRLLVKW
jgi:hypothetical protein